MGPQSLPKREVLFRGTVVALGAGPVSATRPRVCTGAVNKRQAGPRPAQGLGGCGFFFLCHLYPGPTAAISAHTSRRGAAHPRLADSCSVFAQQTLRNAVGRENISLPSDLNIQSNNKPPQAIACSVLINSPFNGFQRSLPNTNALSRASVKSATVPRGAPGHVGPPAVGRKCVAHVGCLACGLILRWRIGVGVGGAAGRRKGGTGVQGGSDSASGAACGAQCSRLGYVV